MNIIVKKKLFKNFFITFWPVYYDVSNLIHGTSHVLTHTLYIIQLQISSNNQNFNPHFILTLNKIHLWIIALHWGTSQVPVVCRLIFIYKLKSAALARPSLLHLCGGAAHSVLHFTKVIDNNPHASLTAKKQNKRYNVCLHLLFMYLFIFQLIVNYKCFLFFRLLHGDSSLFTKTPWIL